MKKLELLVIFIIVIFFCYASYWTGYGAGTLNAIKIAAEHVEEVLDIQLSSRAKMVMLGNPKILFQILTPDSIDKLLKGYANAAELKGALGPDYWLYNKLIIQTT